MDRLEAVVSSDDFGFFHHVESIKVGTRFLMPYTLVNKDKRTAEKLYKCYEVESEPDLMPSIAPTQRRFFVKKVEISPDALKEHPILLVCKEGWQSSLHFIRY